MNQWPKGEGEQQLMRNVQDLRRQLEFTHHNLETLESLEKNLPKSQRAIAGDTHSVASSTPTRVPPLTLDDLSPDPLTLMNKYQSTDFYPPPAVNSGRSIPLMPNPDLNHESGKEATQHSRDYQRSSASGGSTNLSYNNESLRHRLQGLREENSRLVSQNHSIVNQLEDQGFQLYQKGQQLEATLQQVESTRAENGKLQEEITGLREQGHIHHSTLRSAEERWEQSEAQLIEAKETLAKLREENASVSKLLKKMQNERESALRAAEKIQQSYEQFKFKAKEQQEQNESYKENLMMQLNHSNKEQENLLNNVAHLQLTIEGLQEQIQNVKEDQNLEAEARNDTDEHNLQLRSQIAEDRHHIKYLEGQVQELEELRLEKQQLQRVIEQQELQLRKCQQEIGYSQAQLSQLEAVAHHLQSRAGESVARDSGHSTGTDQTTNGQEDLDGSYLETLSKPSQQASGAVISQLKHQLSERDTEIQTLNIRLQNLPNNDAQITKSVSELQKLQHEFESLSLELKKGEERASELENLVLRIEGERDQLAQQLTLLQQQLAARDLDRGSLDTRLGHRSAQLSQLQEQLTAKISQNSALERQLRKTRSQVVSLEKQLHDKVSEAAEQAVKLTHLEPLMERDKKELEQVKNHLMQVTQERARHEAMVARMKELHIEQCQELEKQIEIVQKKFQEQADRLKREEHNVQELKQTNSLTELSLLDLKHDLASQEKDYQSKIRHVEQLAQRESTHVQEVQAALTVCQEELALQLDQIDKTRQHQEGMIHTKQKQIGDLHEQKKSLVKELGSRDSVINELEQTLAERQDMLENSARRISELEDTQAQLQNQVSKLEKNIQNTKSRQVDDLSRGERKLQQALEDLQLKNKEIVTLKDALRDVERQNSQIKESELDLKQQLQHEQHEEEEHASKLIESENALRNLASQLREREAAASDMEDELLRLRQDVEDKDKKMKEVTTKLKNTQNDLQELKTQTDELQKCIQYTQDDMKNRDDKVTDLQQQLRQKQDESRSKSREIEQLEQSLRERQWQIQQRATQIVELEVAIREQQSQLEQKVIDLEATGDKKSLDMQHTNQQLSEMRVKTEELERSLQDKTQQLQTTLHQAERLQQAMQERQRQLTQREQQLSSNNKNLQEIYNEKKSFEDELKKLSTSHQKLQGEFAQARHEASEALLEKERYCRQLEQTQQQIKVRDEEVGKLAGQISQVQLFNESKSENQMQQLHQHLKEQQEQHRKELQDLKTSHAQIMSTKEDLQVQQVLLLQQARDELESTSRHAQSIQQKLADNYIELHTTKDQLHNATETVIIKEAEIVRLEARVSSYNRLLQAMDLDNSRSDQASHYSPVNPASPKQTYDVRGSFSTGSMQLPQQPVGYQQSDGNRLINIQTTESHKKPLSQPSSHNGAVAKEDTSAGTGHYSHVNVSDSSSLQNMLMQVNTLMQQSDKQPKVYMPDKYHQLEQNKPSTLSSDAATVNQNTPLKSETASHNTKRQIGKQKDQVNVYHSSPKSTHPTSASRIPSATSRMSKGASAGAKTSTSRPSQQGQRLKTLADNISKKKSSQKNVRVATSSTAIKNSKSENDQSQNVGPVVTQDRNGFVRTELSPNLTRHSPNMSTAISHYTQDTSAVSTSHPMPSSHISVDSNYSSDYILSDAKRLALNDELDRISDDSSSLHTLSFPLEEGFDLLGDSPHLLTNSNPDDLFGELDAQNSLTELEQAKKMLQERQAQIKSELKLVNDQLSDDMPAKT